MTSWTTRTPPSTPTFGLRLSSHYWLLGNNGDYVANNGDYIGVRFENTDQDREEAISTTWGGRTPPSTTWTTR